MTHTPGPWKMVGQYRANHQDEIRLRIDGPNGYIALTEPYNGNNREIVANAHLIAAAPDLLAALEETLQALIDMLLDRDYTEESINSDPAVIKARAAIAKARGES